MFGVENSRLLKVLLTKVCGRGTKSSIATGKADDVALNEAGRDIVPAPWFPTDCRPGMSMPGGTYNVSLSLSSSVVWLG